MGAPARRFASAQPFPADSARDGLRLGRLLLAGLSTAALELLVYDALLGDDQMPPDEHAEPPCDQIPDHARGECANANLEQRDRCLQGEYGGDRKPCDT